MIFKNDNIEAPPAPPWPSAEARHQIRIPSSLGMPAALGEHHATWLRYPEWTQIFT